MALDSMIVIPCYNEEKRLDRQAFTDFLTANSEVAFLFVNDGSRDGTLNVLRVLATSQPDRLFVLHLEKNGGKAEAVRRGVLEAISHSPLYIGFWDADLATPLDAIPLFRQQLSKNPQLDMVIGARIRLLGRQIDRKATRHYLGRVFATAASLTLGLGVYDTQCGAKLFRASEEIVDLFRDPFFTNWVFDVELIARLIQARRGTARPKAKDSILELPLEQWHDVAGSKIRWSDFPKGAGELWTIYWNYIRQ